MRDPGNEVDVKISLLLWLHNKLHLSDRKMLWYFIGVYIINRTLHGHLEIPNFSSCVKKTIVILNHSLKTFLFKITYAVVHCIVTSN